MTPAPRSSVGRGFRLADGFWLDSFSLHKHDIMIHHAIENEMRVKFYAESAEADVLLERLPYRQAELKDELLKEIETIRHPELKEAVLNMAAWVAHERGFPFYPRSYLDWQEAYLNNTKLPNSGGMKQRTSMKVSEYLLKARLWAVGEGKRVTESPARSHYRR